MKNKILYLSVLILLTIPSALFAMESGLQIEERDITKDEQETKEETTPSTAQISNNEKMDLSPLPQEALLLLAQYVGCSEAQNYIKDNVPVSTLIINSQEKPLSKSKLLAISPDNTLLAVAIEDTSATATSAAYIVQVHEIMSGTLVRTFNVPSDLTCIKFSPDSKYIACSNTQGFMEIFEAATGNLHNAWQDIDKSSIRSFSFNGTKQIVATHSKGNTVEIYTTNYKAPTPFITPFPPLTSPLLSAKGKYVVTVKGISSNPTVIVWDTTSTKPLWTFHLEKAGQLIPTNKSQSIFKQAQFSPDEKYLAVFWSKSGRGEQDKLSHITVYDLSTGDVIKEFCENEPVIDFAFGNTSNIIFTTGRNNTIKLWNIHTGSVVKELDSTVPVVYESKVEVQNQSKVEVQNQLKVAVQNQPADYLAISNNDNHLVAAYFNCNHLKFCSGLAYVDKESREKFLFDDTKLKPSQIILLKALLNQLTKAAQENKIVTLNPEDTKLYFYKLPTEVQKIFKQFIEFPTRGAQIKN